MQLFELQDRHKTLGCTLILTSNHVITMLEDFTAPLRRLNSQTNTATVSPRKNTLIDTPSITSISRKLSSSSTIITNDMNDVIICFIILIIFVFYIFVFNIF